MEKTRYLITRSGLKESDRGWFIETLATVTKKHDPYPSIRQHYLWRTEDIFNCLIRNGFTIIYASKEVMKFFDDHNIAYFRSLDREKNDE